MWFLLLANGMESHVVLSTLRRETKKLEEPMRNYFSKFVRNEDGVTLIEYGLIAALVAVALVAGLGGLATNLGTLFNNVGAKL